MARRSKGLGRRLFLQGIGGAAVALPMLELTHGTAWSQVGTGVAKRFIVVFSHGGEIVPTTNRGAKSDGLGNHHGENWWRPADPGESLVLGRTHTGVLDGLVDELVVVEGVDNRAAIEPSPYSGGHGWANVTALSAADVAIEGDDKIGLGPSIDHVLATRLAARQPVAFPSINLQISGHQYGSPFFRGPRERISLEPSPRAAFDRVFAGIGAEPDPAILRQRAMRRSVLDGVREGLGLFRARLGSADVHRLDAHIDHVRELERRIEALEAVECTAPEIASTPRGTSQRVIGDLHCDIILAAFRCGLTNVATLDVADIICDWLPNPHPAAYNIGHSLHHDARDIGPTGPKHGSYDDWFATIGPNRQWRAELVRKLVEGLRDTPEGAGSMLDESLLLYTSEFSNGAVHSSADLPVLLAGRAGGALRTGRHLNYNTEAAADPDTRRYATQASTHNLFTSILHAFGEDDEHFGNDLAVVRGPLSGLLG